MAGLIRAFKWEDTPLGHPDGWPLSLLTSVSTMLSSKFPMLLYWGKDLRLFYNDAFRTSLGNHGKHPGALGQRGQDCWPEMWPTIKPLLDQVMAGEEATWEENQLLPLYRNGQLEDVYWTFSCCTLRMDSGHINGVMVVCQETTQLLLAQQKLHQSELRFRTLVEQAPMGIALLSGRELRIKIANKSLHQIWGNDATVIGMTLLEAQPTLKGQRFIHLLEAVYDTGEPYFGTGELAQVERNGGLQDAYFNFAYMPLRNESERIIGVMIMVTEVTAQKERELILNQSLLREQELNQLKSRFVSIVSHEFRTPLATIQSSTDLINAYLTTSQEVAKLAIQKHLGVIGKQIKQMNELMTDLLTMGTIEAGKVALQPSWADVRALCQQVIDKHFSNQPDGRNVNFSWEGVPYNAFLDEKLMSHVLANLLTNAFKYAQTNPRLLLHFNAETITVQVIDTGIGIPAKDLSSLFQPFFRASNAKSIQGTGLGLVIARQFIELQGGTLTVDSKEGLGSTFTIVLLNGSMG